METSVEARLHELESRIAKLEGAVLTPAPGPKARPAPQPLTPLPPPVAPPAPPTPPRADPFDFEEVFGGRVLGWVGGVAVVLAVVFFLIMAVHNGWIDVPTRVVLAFVGSTALFATGVWLYEWKGRTEAALAAVAAGTAALYASTTAATVVYGLVPVALGLVVAGLIGVAATAVAVRWNSEIVAAIGLVGALLAPVLVDAGSTAASLAFMTVALCATVGVLLWRRWGWLSSIAFVVTAPQAAHWIVQEHHLHLALSLAVLAGFWALYIVAALGYELRVPTADLRISSALVLLADTAFTVGLGWALLRDAGHGDGATAWVVAAALVYVVLGAVVLRGRISKEIAALLIAFGAALAAIGMALALSGLVLVAGWAAESVLLAWIGRRHDVRAFIGALVFLALAGGHALVLEAPPSALAYGLDELGRGLVALGIVLAAAVADARLLDRAGRNEEAAIVSFASAVWALYLCSVAVVDLAGAHQGSVVQHAQLALSAFWATLGFAALVTGLVRDVRVMRVGGLALLGLAVAKVFLVDLAALQSIWRVASFLALGLLLLAGAFAYQRMRKVAS